MGIPRSELAMTRYLTAAFATAFALFLIVALPTPGHSRSAQDGMAHPPVSVAADGLALSGHDAVAYFTEGAPRPGLAEHSLQWNGATWRFASAEHMALFQANPQAYAPQFGGYCAWATSQGYIAPGNPEHWRIVEGQLFLNFNGRAQMLWEQDVAGNIAKGRSHWPRVLTQNQG